ncbi:MAG TPA: hypothetical protein VHC90_18290 [Bryobacteraceae bacterium]|nr:hypothetical protein [Bryobacteraceae bacterium]
MPSRSQLSKSRVWGVIAGTLICLPALCESAPATKAIPADPLEMATGQVRPVRNLAGRTAVLTMLGRARDRYGLRGAGSAYDLKVTFNVDSGGQTDFDGAWQMEDVFDPKLGLRWTAKNAGAYSITRISSHGAIWEDATANDIPLRLEEARAALLDPIAPAGSVAREALRTTRGTLNGVQLDCILYAGGTDGADSKAGAGRRWQESEDCIDPTSGLLRVHSQVPGRYYLYDYSRQVQLGGRLLPGKVTVTEGGKTVSEISVESLTQIPSAEPALFAPTDAMKAKGQVTPLGGAQKRVLTIGQGAVSDVVCVFGAVTTAGQLTEAHSLEPSDPNSEKAVTAAKEKFSFAPLPGAHEQQHFIFVITRFLSD